MVDWDGLDGLEGLVATGVRGTMEGVDACVKASGGSRVMVDYLAATRETHVIFQLLGLNSTMSGW